MTDDILPAHHYELAGSLERQLLGAVILDPSRLDALQDSVTLSDFHDVDIGRAYRLLVNLRASGKPIHDINVVESELRKASLLDAIGGRAGIAKIVNQAVASNAEWYAAEVRRLSDIRSNALFANQLLHDCQSNNAEPISQREQAIAELQSFQHCDTDDVATVGDVLDDAMVAIDTARARGHSIGLSTGFPSLDQATGGFFPSELTVLAARPSIGKSAFALELAYQMGLRGKSSLLVSLEMNRESIGLRLLNRATGIPIRKIQSGQMREHEFDELRQARIALRELPIRVMDASSATVAKIGARARVAIAQGGMDLLIVDYLGLVDAHDRRMNVYERTTAVSRDFRMLAGQLNRPILLLAQLNRQGEGERPTLAMLRDSGAIEQDANNVLFLHRQQRDSRECELIVAKQRQGEIGMLPFEFDGGRMAFFETHGGEQWAA